MTDISRFVSDEKYFTIACQDIILREFIASDYEAFHALTWQPEIYAYLPGWNVTEAQRKHWLLHYEIPENKRFLEAVARGGDIGELRLRMGILSKESGAFIGWCCTGIKEELPAPNREIVFAISKEHRGRGYTTQAVRGLTGFLFAHTDVEWLNAIALIHNSPSNRVIQKSGFRLAGTVDIEEETFKHYKIHKTALV